MENKIKHLEFIQSVINRLSNNSFLIKGWSVVLVSALFALSANNSNVKFILLAYIPAIAFWGLDGYFLSLERSYRNLFDEVRKLTDDKINFSMKTRKEDRGLGCWAQSTISASLIFFHGALIGAIICVMVIQK